MHSLDYTAIMIITCYVPVLHLHVDSESMLETSKHYETNWIHIGIYISVGVLCGVMCVVITILITVVIVRRGTRAMYT